MRLIVLFELDPFIKSSNYILMFLLVDCVSQCYEFVDKNTPIKLLIRGVN